MVKEIYLANNKGISFVTDEDYEWLNQYKWYLTLGYAKTSIKINNKWTTKFMHRLIMNEPKNMQIDHIDNNRLNNQKNNLRIVTHSQNAMNKTSVTNSSSKFKGVSFKKRWDKWESQIEINKKIYYLGSFNNEKDAAKAYNEKAKELFSEYACLNEVNE